MQTAEADMSRVLVCVPSYNKLQQLRQCLEHISRIEQSTGFEVKVLVVDSGSDNQQVARLIREVKDVELKKIENKGYVGCVNEGLLYAIEKNYNYMLVVTDDAFVETNVIKELIYPLMDDEKAAISGCKILHITKDLSGNKRTVVMTGAYLGESLCCRGRNVAENCKGLTACDWVNGAVVGMKVDVFKQVGLLDDSFFMYFDELDLGLKLKRAGYHALYVPWVEVIHESGSDFYGITSKKGGAYARYYLTRNVALLYYRMSPLKFLLFLPYYLGAAIFRSTILLLRGRNDCSLAILRGVRDFFRGNFGRGPY